MMAAKESIRPKTRPFPVRLTEAERAELDRRSGDMAVGAYVKCVLFADGDKPNHRGSRVPVKDQAALASVLARMGASRSAEWLAMLAHAAECGTLPVDDATKTRLNQACHDVLVIRLLLMQALGLRIEGERDHRDLSAAFASADGRDGAGQ